MRVLCCTFRSLRVLFDSWDDFRFGVVCVYCFLGVEV